MLTLGSTTGAFFAGSAVWPGNLEAHLARKSAGTKAATAEDHRAYLESVGLAPGSICISCRPR